MNNQKDLINSLSHFGMEKSDAIVYLGLLQMGSVTVGTMSSKLEIDRGKAYRSLNKLRNLGLVSTTFSCLLANNNNTLSSWKFLNHF